MNEKLKTELSILPFYDLSIEFWPNVSRLLNFRNLAPDFSTRNLPPEIARDIKMICKYDIYDSTYSIETYREDTIYLGI